MKLESFHTLAQKWAQTATINGKPITITFTGQTAFTDGQRINLPSMPSGTILTPHQLALYNGYIDHERGHIAYSDFQIVKSFKSISEPLKALWNIFEDIRVENRIINDFPGSRKYLDHLCHEVDKNITPNGISANSTAPKVMELIYQESYGKYRGIDTHHIPNTLAIHFPQIAREMQNLPSCQSTQDTLDLARKILALIETQPKTQPESQQRTKDAPQTATESQYRATQQTEPLTESQQTESQQSNRVNNGGNNQDDKNNIRIADEITADFIPDSEMEDSLGDDANPSGAGNNAGNNSVDNDTDICSLNTTGGNIPSLDQQAQEILSLKNSVSQIIKSLQETVNSQWKTNENTTIDLEGKVILPPADPSRDRLWVRPQNPDLQRYEETKQKVSLEINALKKGLNLYLISRSQRAWSRGLEEGQELDRENLHNVALPGNPQVYKSRRERQLINTAIELTIDLSASMSSGLTTSAAIIIAEAIASVGNHLKLSITGFSCKSDERRTGNLPGAGRLTPMTITTFKDFDEPFIKARKYLGAIQTHGFTPLGDAYGKALERILHRPEPRRIIWIISDGRPEFNVGNHHHSDLLLMSKIHQKTKKLSIDTLGIEIVKRDLLSPYVDYAVFIPNRQELPRALLVTIKKAVIVKYAA